MDPQDAWHFIPMILGVLVLIAAAWIGAKDKGGRKVMTHKAVAGTGAAVVLLGVAWLAVTRALEPDLMHFYSALAASVLVVVMPFAGLYALKAVPAKKAGLRRSHRLGAAVVLGLAVLTMVLGLLDK
jgi:hypothetical protein